MVDKVLPVDREALGKWLFDNRDNLRYGQVREQYSVDDYSPGFDDMRREAFDRWLASVVDAARAEGAAAEREACARRFDAIAAEYREKALRYIPGEAHSWHIRRAEEAEEHAAAIRARSGDGDPLTTHERST